MSAKEKTFYEILGVPQSASSLDIKSAYRRRVRVAHPDYHRNRPEEVQRLADEQIRMLNEAYSVLRKKARRELYDACLREGLDFHEAEQASRPESEAERQVREAAEQLEIEGFKKASQESLAALQGLMPQCKWRNDPPSDPYFDAMATGQAGPVKYTVWAKLLPVLSAADVPGLTQYGQALIAEIRPGLIREHHAYLLMGRTVEESPELMQAIYDFNTKNFQLVTGRAPRAMIGYGSATTGIIQVPGVTKPDPPLSSLRLNLGRHFIL